MLAAVWAGPMTLKLRVIPRLSHMLGLCSQRCGHTSAWIDKSRADYDNTLHTSSIDVEKLFIDKDVQSILKDLTGLDLENKVFRERRTSIQQRSHFALMTDERLSETLDKMRDEAKHFLKFVPVKEPRSEEVIILSKDVEISNFDTCKFVFTDITFDATDQDRTVVVREVDGTLRTGTPEEHDRMNRTYYPKPNRPVFEPPVFRKPYLQDALKRGEHEFVLDWACWFYEPDDPKFVKLCQKVFDEIVATESFDVLHSTRHFGMFVFYLALNGNIPPLLNYFGALGRIRECANLIRLQKTLHPDWRVAIGSEDSDVQIVRDYIKQNARFRNSLSDLNAFLKDGIVKKMSTKSVNISAAVRDNPEVTLNKNNIGSSSGPLGELSAGYSVKLAKGGEAELFTHQRKPSRGRFAPKPSKKAKDSDQDND